MTRWMQQKEKLIRSTDIMINIDETTIKWKENAFCSHTRHEPIALGNNVILAKKIHIASFGTIISSGDKKFQ